MTDQELTKLTVETERAELAERELSRWVAAAKWMKHDWPNIEIGGSGTAVYRLEPGQLEERVFEAAEFLDAIEMAMAAPPFTGGTTWPELRGFQAKIIAKLDAARADNTALRNTLEQVLKCESHKIDKRTIAIIRSVLALTTPAAI